ncbi:formin-like protein 7 [Drosophila madeirensis]|uniref:Formin-like protein 7 n=1 Tax=Drosophila madeirensis TaxID=30013 RepID=A0AAU9EV25_DROMD
MEGYSYAYISEPVEFRHVEGKALDFRKTFDVRGRGTDEMLQLYLRKANLPDDLDRLPAIQRRAYVYDIIRSHKEPGYWVPPSMQVSSNVFDNPPPAVRPPPAAARATTYADNGSLYSMKSSSSSNSLDRYAGAPTAAAIAGPSFATSVLVSSKGSKYEISGPVNFQHVSGDVTRDRTRNAFDLNADANDNVLRKYMMERGITEADIADMRRQDVVKKIVHSNFTWMPKKQEIQAKPKVQEQQHQRPLLYATISTNNQITPPPSPPPTPLILKPGPTPSFANYAALTSRFVDISDMDMPPVGRPTAAQTPFRQQEVGSVIPVQVQPQPHQVNRPKVPPPPSAVTANNTYAYPAAIDARQVRPSATPKSAPETYATIAPQRKAGTMRMPPPAPPKPTIVPNTSSVMPVQYAPVCTKPPPPAPPAKPASSIKAPAATYVPPPPQQYKPSPKATAAVAASGAPPPPPPMPVSAASGGPPPPPPMPSAAFGAPPPPPMPVSSAAASKAIQNSDLPKAAPSASAGGDRDAFLESIRNGVALKKVDQKAATISGIKPRPERKAAPPAMDFMSELKLGLTLRRTKNPADNPYSDESQA